MSWGCGVWWLEGRAWALVGGVGVVPDGYSGRGDVMERWLQKDLTPHPWPRNAAGRCGLEEGQAWPRSCLSGPAPLLPSP